MVIQDTKIQYRLTAGSALQARLLDRTDRFGTGDGVNAHARAELALWYGVLNAELARLSFTLKELLCIADIMKDAPTVAMLTNADAFVSVGYVYGKAYRAIRQARVDAGTYWVPRWDLDGHKLLEKLGALGPAADHALLDAISRFIAAPGEASAEGFAKVGLNAAPEVPRGRQ